MPRIYPFKSGATTRSTPFKEKTPIYEEKFLGYIDGIHPDMIRVSTEKLRSPASKKPPGVTSLSTNSGLSTSRSDIKREKNNSMIIPIYWSYTGNFYIPIEGVCIRQGFADNNIESVDDLDMVEYFIPMPLIAGSKYYHELKGLSVSYKEDAYQYLYIDVKTYYNNKDQVIFSDSAPTPIIINRGLMQVEETALDNYFSNNSILQDIASYGEGTGSANSTSALTGGLLFETCIPVKLVSFKTSVDSGAGGCVLNIFRYLNGSDDYADGAILYTQAVTTLTVGDNTITVDYILAPGRYYLSINPTNTILLDTIVTAGICTPYLTHKLMPISGGYLQADDNTYPAWGGGDDGTWAHIYEMVLQARSSDLYLGTNAPASSTDKAWEGMAGFSDTKFRVYSGSKWRENDLGDM